MIPIDETKAEVKEIDGVKYSLLPIVGEIELLYYRVIEFSGPKDLKKFIAEAKAQVDSENKAKVWEQGEREKLIRERAAKQADLENSSNSVYDNPEMITALDALIDAVLTGWATDSTDIMLPKFPEHRHPSRCFKLADKLKLLNLISDMNLIEEKERKN